MNRKQQAAFDAIVREREYQNGKWGDVGVNHHSTGEWILVLEDRIAKAKRQWYDGGPHDKLMEEILTVAAVAVAAMEEHGVHERGIVGCDLSINLTKC